MIYWTEYTYLLTYLLAPSSDTQVCRNISSTVQYTAAIMHADLYLD